MKRTERRRVHTVAERSETAAQRRAAARHRDVVAELHGIRRKDLRVLGRERDTLLGRDAVIYLAQPRRGEGFGYEHHLATRQGAQRRIHVVEMRIRQLDRDGLDAEGVLDEGGGVALGARAVAHPEHLPRRVPDAIARTLGNEARRRAVDGGDRAARPELAEGALVIGLLALALGMAEMREQ